jgi:glutathione synthase/RimK-type ligase-like ATP-grasp enzyme
MIDLRLVRGSITGAQLRALLAERGVQIGTQGAGGIVSYGVRVENPALPCLNALAGARNKFEELHDLSAGGVHVPAHSLDGEILEFPILGRKFKHTKGKDILPVLADDVTFEWAKQTSDFFTQYLPLQTEFRVWIYRRRRLATYEKRMERVEEYRRVGANYQNGTAFKFVPEPPDGLTELAARAVDVLGLDFGAVDILQHVDGSFYVLEVNTAPGQEGIRAALTNLANKIVRWEQRGYPRRRGDGD